MRRHVSSQATRLGRRTNDSSNVRVSASGMVLFIAYLGPKEPVRGSGTVCSRRPGCRLADMGAGSVEWRPSVNIYWAAQNASSGQMGAEAAGMWDRYRAKEGERANEVELRGV